MSALELVNTLKARGVHLSLESGRIRYEPRSSVFDDDLERLRTYRAEVVKLLERPTLPAQDTPQTPCSNHTQRPALERLPPKLERLIGRAVAGALPGGAVQLSSGLVMDLNAYTMAWACAYLMGDGEEARKRLLEAAQK